MSIGNYVDGRIHTNSLEKFWGLLKRGIDGTCVSVEPFYLLCYLDEQALHHNDRKDAGGEPLDDADRFDIAVRQIVGKRLTWDRLTGRDRGLAADNQTPEQGSSKANQFRRFFAFCLATYLQRSRDILMYTPCDGRKVRKHDEKHGKGKDSTATA